ncbi:MAG: TonB-dependent receptor, partial [Thermodesulfobacteriota bacterium]|nr:TonB-dependent receptor [Thermodesulfobacteriota bacterium]
HLNAPNGSALGVRSARLTYYLYSEPNCQRPYGAPENDYILKEFAKYGAPLNGYDFSATLMTRHVGRQYKSDDEKADDYTLTDIAVSKNFGNMQQYEIYGGINNIFDENVDKALGSNVGRFYYVGARVSF